MAAQLLGQAVFRITSDIKSFVTGLAAGGDAAKAFTKKAKAIGTAMRTVGMQAGMAALAIAAAFAPVLLIGGKFERSMSKVGAVMQSSMARLATENRTVGDQFRELSDEAQRLGETTRYTASEAAEAMKFLGLAGFDTNEVLVATEATLMLAAAGGLELARAADIASDATTAFGLSASSMIRVIDAMAAAATNSNTSVEQMGEAFKYAAPMMATMGVNVEELSVMLGLLGNAGIKGSMAGTSVANAFSQLAKKGDDLNGVLGRFGLTFDQINPEMVKSRDIIKTLAATSMGATDFLEMFGIRGGKAIAAMVMQIRNAPEAFYELENAIENASGVAQSVAEQMEDNVGGRFLLLKSAVEGMFIAIFDALKVGLKDILIAIAQIIGRITEWIKANKQTVTSIVAVVASIGAALGSVSVITIAIGALAGAVVAIKAAFVALAGVSAAVVGKALLILAPIIFGVVAAFKVLTAVFTEVKNLALAVWENAFKPMWEGFKVVAGWVLSVLVPLWDFMVTQIKSAIASITELVKASKIMRQVFVILGGVIAGIVTVALTPIIIGFAAVTVAIGAVAWIVTKLTDGWIHFLRVFGGGKEMETSAERAARLKEEKEDLVSAEDQWRESQRKTNEELKKTNETMLKQAELAKLGETANLKQKKELLEMMEKDGNLLPKNNEDMQRRIDALEAEKNKIEAVITRRKEHGLDVQQEQKLLRELKLQLSQLTAVQETLFDAEGKRREGIVANMDALRESIRLEEEKIAISKAAEEATEGLKSSEKKLADLRKSLAKRYQSDLDGEIEKLNDLHATQVELIETRRKEHDALIRKMKFDHQLAEANHKQSQARLRAMALEAEANGRLAYAEKLRADIRKADETHRGQQAAVSDDIAAIEEEKKEEADLLRQHEEQVAEDKQDLLDKAEQNRQDMARDREIEEAKLSGDRLTQVKLENEKRLDEAHERNERELQISKEMTQREKDEVWAERTKQLELVEAQNKERLRKVQEEIDGREEIPKRIEKERDLEMETWKIMLGKVQSMQQLYQLHMMMHKLNFIRENRSLLAAKKLQAAELKLANLKRIRDQGGGGGGIDNRIRNAELEAQHARFRAGARMAEAKQEEGLAEEQKKRAETLRQAFAALQAEVTASRANINQTISMISMDFLEAPWKWVEQWLIGWEVQSQRMIDAVRATMAQMKAEMHPDMRHSPSFRDIWEMNARVVDDNVRQIGKSVGSGTTSAGRMGGIAPAMGVQTLNDSRKVAMTVHNKMDGEAVTRQIGKALGKSIARRGTI